MHQDSSAPIQFLSPVAVTALLLFSFHGHLSHLLTPRPGMLVVLMPHLQWPKGLHALALLGQPAGLPLGSMLCGYAPYGISKGKGVSKIHRGPSMPLKYIIMMGLIGF